MKINWDYSIESEAKRIVQTAKQMVTGFYRLNGFYVLPYSNEKSHSNGNFVYLPEINYNSISRFWDKVKRADIYHMTFEGDNKLVEDLSDMVSKFNLKEPLLENADMVWEKMEKEFFKALEVIIPVAKNSIKRITVHPTYFGTKCSFNVPESFPGDLEIYLRTDQDVIYGLVEAVVSALTKESVYRKLEGNWQESELLVDWIITESALGKVVGKYHNLSHYHPTIKNSQIQQNAEIIRVSEEFYRRLGIQAFSKPFSIKNNIPLHFGVEFENITPNELAVLLRLIENENKITTMDEISDLISVKDEDFSLYSISKTIQRVRDKFEQNGISGSFIQTMRGKGYILRN